MRKNLLKELVLPAFWLFFFIASSKSEKKDASLKKATNKELKQQDISTGTEGNIDKNKQSIFTKAIYLSGF